MKQEKFKGNYKLRGKLAKYTNHVNVMFSTDSKAHWAFSAIMTILAFLYFNASCFVIHAWLCVPWEHMNPGHWEKLCFWWPTHIQCVFYIIIPKCVYMGEKKLIHIRERQKPLSHFKWLYSKLYMHASPLEKWCWGTKMIQCKFWGMGTNMKGSES